VIPFKPDKDFVPQVGDVYEIKHSYDKVLRRHMVLEVKNGAGLHSPVWRCKFITMSADGQIEKTHYKTIGFGSRNNSLMCVARVEEEEPCK
jgi:hypothetical protein